MLTKDDLTIKNNEPIFNFIEAINEPLTTSYYIEVGDHLPSKFKVVASNSTKSKRLSSKLELVGTIGIKKNEPLKREDKIFILKALAMQALISLYYHLLSIGVKIVPETFLIEPIDDDIEKSLNNKNFLN